MCKEITFVQYTELALWVIYVQQGVGHPFMEKMSREGGERNPLEGKDETRRDNGLSLFMSTLRSRVILDVGVRTSIKDGRFCLQHGVN